MGRAKEVKEFVRFGMKKAFIEITLHDDEPNVISRVITRDNKSQFKLNGKNVSKAKVLELVASYVVVVVSQKRMNSTTTTTTTVTRSNSTICVRSYPKTRSKRLQI